MTDKICPQSLCTGCGACVAVCPKHCISLQPNPQGHLLPKIDTNVCVSCNLCHNTCPVNKPVAMHEPILCYAGWSKDEHDRNTSSSGGASSVFAAHFINEGDIVYGAAVKDNKIQHIRISKAEDLNLIKGSKYVYSYAADVYPLIKKDLSDGKKVLFIGTPCQNAAVYNLTDNNLNLTLVNIICHGVPSMQILKEHLKSHNITEIKNIQFRNGNDIYDFRCNDYHALDCILPDVYVTCFLKGGSYRSSCYNCTYAQSERIGDVTIGDFWGLGKIKSFLGGDINKGCSVIIINTDKGKNLIDSCRNRLHLFEREYREAVEGNAQLRSPVKDDYALHFNKYYSKFPFLLAAWLTFPWVLFKQLVRNLRIFNIPIDFIKYILRKINKKS